MKQTKGRRLLAMLLALILALSCSNAVWAAPEEGSETPDRTYTAMTWAELCDICHVRIPADLPSGGTVEIIIGANMASDTTAPWFSRANVTYTVSNPNGYVIDMSVRKDQTTMANAGGVFHVGSGANVTFDGLKLDGGMTTDIAAVAESQGLAGLDSSGKIAGVKKAHGIIMCQDGTLTLSNCDIYNFCSTADNQSQLIGVGNGVATVNVTNGTKFHNIWGMDGVIFGTWSKNAKVNIYDMDMYHNFAREESFFDAYDGYGGAFNFYGGKIHDNYGMQYTDSARSGTINLWTGLEGGTDANYPNWVRHRISGSGGDTNNDGIPDRKGIQVYDNFMLKNTSASYTNASGSLNGSPVKSNMGLLFNWNATTAATIKDNAYHAAVADMTPNDNLWLGPNSCSLYTTGYHAMNVVATWFGSQGAPYAYFSDTNPNDGIADGVYADMADLPNSNLYGNTRLGLYEGPIESGAESVTIDFDGEQKTFTRMLYLTTRTADITYELYDARTGAEISEMSGLTYPYTKRVGLPSDFAVSITGPTDTSGTYELVQYAWDDEDPANVDENGATSEKTLADQGTYTVKFYYNDTTAPGEDELTSIDLDVDGDGIPDINIDTDNDGKPDVNLQPNYIPTTADGVKNDAGDGWYYPTAAGGTVQPNPVKNIDTNGDGTWEPSKDEADDRVISPDKNIDTDGDGDIDIPTLDRDVYPQGTPEEGSNVDPYWVPNIDSADGTYDTGDPRLNRDTDGDDVPDTDIDVDGDGIPDVNVDTDKDGIADTNLDPNLFDPDKAADQFVDTNGDGKITPDESGTYKGTPTLNLDTDGTGTWTPSGDKTDPDNIWMPDKNVDKNGDGTPDLFTDDPYSREPIDENGDGRDDSWNPETPFTTEPLKDNAETGDPTLNIDTNGDKIPDTNLDVDGDGIPDVNVDTDNDKIPDTNLDPKLFDKTPGVAAGQFEDANDDGKLTADEYTGEPTLNLDTDGTGTWTPSGDKTNPDNIWMPDTNVDTDGNGVPDSFTDTPYGRDPVDDNNDGRDDNWNPATPFTADPLKNNAETGNPNTNGNDIDGDGTDDINIDVDGDGIPDLNIDTDGDKKPDVNVFTNGTGEFKGSKDYEALKTPKTVAPDTNVDTNGKHEVMSRDDGGKNNTYWCSAYPSNDKILLPDTAVDTDGIAATPGENLNLNPVAGEPFGTTPGWSVDSKWVPDVDANMTAADDSPKTGYDTCNPSINIDTDDDGVPDTNVDVDGDGIPDVNVDTDEDGIADTNLDPNLFDPDKAADQFEDTNGDGKITADECETYKGEPALNLDTDGTGTWKPSGSKTDPDNIWMPDKNVDKDGDGTPDLFTDAPYSRDPIDKDGDGRDDSWNPATPFTTEPLKDDAETGNPTLNIDTDDDGKPDTNVDVDGDGIADVNIDTDNDEKPDTNLDNKIADNLGNPVKDPETGKVTYPDYPKDNVGPQLNVDTDEDGNWAPSGELGDGHIISPDKNIDTNGDGQPDKNVDEAVYVPVDENGDGINDNWKPATDMSNTSGYDGMETGDPTEDAMTVTVNVVDLTGKTITDSNSVKIGDKTSTEGQIIVSAKENDELKLTATPTGNYKVIGWYVKDNSGKLVLADPVNYQANNTVAKGKLPYDMDYTVTENVVLYAVFTETVAKDIAGWFDPTDDELHSGSNPGNNQLIGPYLSYNGTQDDGTKEQVMTEWDPVEEKWVVTPMSNLKDVTIPDDPTNTNPPIEIDLNGHNIDGSDGTAADPDGKPALTIGENQDVTVAGPGNVTGGDGLDGEVPGKGGPGVVTGEGAGLGVEDGAIISGGQGGDSTKPGTDAGAGGSGAELGPNSEANVNDGEIKGGNGGDSADADETTPAGAGGEGGAGIDAGTNPDSTVNVGPAGNVTGGDGGNGGNAAATGTDDSQDAGAGGNGGEGVTGTDTGVNNEGNIAGGNGGNGGDNTAEDGNTGDSGAGGEGGSGVNVPEGTVNNGKDPENTGTITGGEGGDGGNNTNTGEGDSGNAGAGGSGGDGVEDATTVDNKVPDGIVGGNAGDGGDSTDEGNGNAGDGGAGGTGGDGIDPGIPDDAITGDGTDNGGTGGNGGSSTDNDDGDAGNGGNGGNGGEGQTVNGGDAGDGGDSTNNDSGETGNGGTGGTGGDGKTPEENGEDGQDGEETNHRGDIDIDPKDPDIIIPDDPYDPNSDGMIIWRGTWANEKTYDNLKAVDAGGNTPAGVTWAVVDDYTTEYGFAEACVSVDENGNVTALKSGIAKVGCYIGGELYSYVVFVVPGDYDRDGEVSGSDSSEISRVEVEIEDIDTRSYSKELADMDKSGDVGGADCSIVEGIEVEIESI